MKNNLFIIAQAGWNYLLASTLLFVLFMILDCEFLATLTFFAIIGFLYFFRNPVREIQSFEEESILSPVDGVISSISELEDSEFTYRIDIESGYFDVSLLRMPTDAEVLTLKYQKGTRVASEENLFDTLNENCEILFENKTNQKIKIKHTLTQSFAPLSLDILESQSMHKGSRYGLMLCGVTSIYLPANVRVNVNLSDKVEGSQSVIAFFS